MIIGGKDKTSVEHWQYSGDEALGDCESFAEAPFPTQNAVALRDAEGRPMICGGSKNPDPRSCHVYDIYTNTWSQGPQLKQRRIASSATCLPNGECWVFGGISSLR